MNGPLGSEQLETNVRILRRHATDKCVPEAVSATTGPAPPEDVTLRFVTVDLLSETVAPKRNVRTEMGNSKRTMRHNANIPEQSIR